MTFSRTSFHAILQAIKCLALGLSILATPTLAQTWQGSTNTDSGLGSNWSTTPVAPGPGDIAKINNGGLANQPSVQSNQTVGSVVLSGGSLALNVGTLTVLNGLALSGTGTLTGQLGATLAGDVVSSGGTLTGNLNIAGNLSLSNASTVFLQVLSPASFNNIAISQTASLAGLLVVDLTSYNGVFPASIDLLTFGSRIGGSTFGTLQFLGQGNYNTGISYTNNSVQLLISAPGQVGVPEAST